MSSALDPASPADGQTSSAPPPTADKPQASRGGARRLLQHHADPIWVGLVALVVYALHGYDGRLDRDFGVFVYGGEHVAHGGVPYVDIFNSVGPLADVVPGLAIWLGHFAGIDPILSSRMFFTLLSALCCSLLCVLARDTLGSRVAGILAPATFLTFECFLRMASDGPREKTTMVVFLLACLILLGRRRWALAGAFAALATLTWQPSFAVAVLAVVAAALLDVQDTRRRVLTRFVVGGMVPSAVTVAYFLAAGALSQAIDGFIIVNARYTTQPSALTQPSLVMSFLWMSYHWTLPLFVVGLVALFVQSARALRAARRPTASTDARRLVVVGAGALAGTVWTASVVNGGPDLFVLLPFAGLGLAAVATPLLARLSGRAGLAAVAVLATACVVTATVESVATRDNRLSIERADVAGVLGTQPPGAVVVSVDDPQVMAIAQRTDPVPYQIFSMTMIHYLKATYPGGMPGLVATLERTKPAFVVVGSTFKGRWPYAWLAQSYSPVGQAHAGYTWYVRRSLGHDALVRAKAAHRAAVLTNGAAAG